MRAVDDRLVRQLEFLLECERLKEVMRRTVTVGSRRAENDAEHSWSVCLLAMTLAEHSNQPVDLLRVIRMLLIHDIVEIDAGDTFAYDEAGMATQHERESIAASRIFGLLPPDQASDFRALWDEFETGRTAEAALAAAVDRLHAVLLSMASDCSEWRRHGVTHERVLQRNRRIGDGSDVLWTHAQALIDGALKAGLLTR